MRWKNLEGYSKYKIFEDGSVYSKSFKIYMSTRKNAEGYVKVSLVGDNGKRKALSLHRILATLFIDNPENKRIVNHKDGKKDNFSLDNLEWVTHSENIKHAWDTGLMSHSKRGIQNISNAAKKMVGKLNSKSKPVINKDTGIEYESQKAASNKTGITQSEISRHCNGVRKKQKWKFKGEKNE